MKILSALKSNLGALAIGIIAVLYFILDKRGRTIAELRTTIEINKLESVLGKTGEKMAVSSARYIELKSKYEQLRKLREQPKDV